MKTIVEHNSHGPVYDFGPDNGWQRHKEVMKELTRWCGKDAIEKAIDITRQQIEQWLKDDVDVLSDETVDMACFYIVFAIHARGAYPYEVYHAALERVIWR